MLPRSLTVVAIVSAAVLFARTASAQIVIDTAPPGNAQALTILGTPTAGQLITIEMQAPPTASAVMFFGTRLTTWVLPFGTVLVDPQAAIGACSFTVGPTGVVQAHCPVQPFLELGAAFVAQGAWQIGGNLTLSNSCRMFVMGTIAPRPTVLEVDPLPRATNAPQVTITGRATEAGSTVLAEGGQTPSTTSASGTNNSFAVTVSLVANRRNRLFLTETTPGGTVRAPVTVEIIQDSQPPELYVDFPANNAQLTEPMVTVTGRVADQLSGFMGLTVQVNGLPAAVNIGIGTNGTFERRDLQLQSTGVPTPITVTASDEVGNVATRQLTVTRIPVLGPRLELVSGNNQTGPVNQFLPAPVVVRVLQGNGQPFADKLVNFAVTRSNGRLATGTAGGGTLALQVRTDPNGLARAFWQLGSDAGCGNNRVEATSAGVTGVIGFCASGAAGPATQINLGSGNNQRAATGAPLPLPLRVWVSDACNGVANVPVTFSVMLGGGSLIPVAGPPSNAITVPTGPTGHAEVVLALGPNAGNNLIRAAIPGGGEAVFFQAIGLASPSGNPTTFVGQVLDNAERPLGGATCQLTVGATTLPAVLSDAAGRFTISGAAAGPGHLFVDGLTVNQVAGSGVPTGSFPALKYEVLVVGSAQNSLPGPVILPPLNPNNARVYSSTNDVTLEVEGIDGLQMLVRAGSMRLPNGNPAPTGTIIALNQVHADKVPMPMPDGASPPFAWTLQPAGATFDPPIQIRYPNMSGLPPGSIAYFLSFNHDTEQFEIVSSAHVTADGSDIVSDPGSGLRTAGWGCNCPPYSVATNCEVCTRTCQQTGTLTGGSVSVTNENPEIGTMVSFSASGVTDPGGSVEVRCPDGSTTTEAVPPGTVEYSYTVTPPTGAAITGNGASVNVNIDQCGRYTCRFVATVMRECAPAPLTLPDKVARGNTNCPDPGVITPTITVLNDIPAGSITGGGLTRVGVADVVINACVYLDASDNWRIRVQDSGWTIHWGINTTFYTEPTLPPTPGATVNCGNAATAVAVMSAYETNQAAGAWHMAAASTAHEMVHVEQNRSHAVTRWPGFETAIEAHVLGACPAMSLAQANAALTTYIDAQRLAWFDPAFVAPEAPAYAAGQAVLNVMIGQINAWVAANCPP